MAKPEPALYTVSAPEGPPTIEEAARQLGLPPADIDREFGVVPIDPARGLYSVRALSVLTPGGAGAKESYQGPFSNPRIKPFGPVQSEPDKK